MSADANHDAGAGRAVMLLSLAAFASALALRLCDPMLPALADGFGVTVARASIVVTATSIAYGICQFVFGPLGDRFGKFRVVAWACLASTVGALGCALSPDLNSLSLARALTGATTAALIPLSMAWIGDTVAFEHRQPTLARFMSGQIVGLVSGQAVGGFFADTLGWRWAFVFLAFFYGVIGILLLREAARVALAHGTGLPREKISVARQLSQVVHAPGTGYVFGTVSLEAMATFGVMAFIPAYLHLAFDISLFHAGAVVALFGLGGLSYTLFARRWVRALGAASLARLGGLLMGLAFLGLAVAPAWGWAIPLCLLAGLGFYQMHNTLQTQATQLVPGARGTAVSLFASCFFLGQAVGVSLSAWLSHRFGFEVLFACSGFLIPVLGWFFGAWLKRTAGEAPA